MDPGGSVKDRAALWMVEAAERSGELKAGGTIVEGTASNTGIGLAHVCSSRGYACVIYMPDNQSKEKVDLLRTLGADVRVVPTVPYANDEDFQKQAGRYAATLDNAIWANQFDNTANRQAHFDSTGPEIWQQTEGKVDVFTCAVGTSGTLAGVFALLKAKLKQCPCGISRPHGQRAAQLGHHRQATMTPGPSITEGIGNSRVTENLAGTEIDESVQVTDQEMVDMCYNLLRQDGWFFGSSSWHLI